MWIKDQRGGRGVRRRPRTGQRGLSAANKIRPRHMREVAGRDIGFLVLA